MVEDQFGQRDQIPGGLHVRPEEAFSGCFVSSSFPRLNFFVALERILGPVEAESDVFAGPRPFAVFVSFCLNVFWVSCQWEP